MGIKDSNITINVKDMEKAISFYQSIGFTLLQRWNNHYAQLTAPGIKIGLHPTTTSDGQKTASNISIGFTTDEFEKTRVQLKELGVKVSERTEEGGNFLHFNDPDGTSLYFIDPKW